MNTKEPMWRKILTVTSNAVMVNGLFLLFCLPVVTIGQAWCGLYTAIRYAIRGEGWFAGFMAGFKTRFWRGTVAWILCLAAVIGIGMKFLDMWGQVPVFTMVINGAFLLMAMMICAALPVLNVYIPTSKTQWVINGVNMCFAVPLQVAAAGVLMWIPAGLTVAFLRFGFYEPMLFIMVFLLGYFTCTTLVSTILLKDYLVKLKNQMEEDGEDEEEA